MSMAFSLPLIAATQQPAVFRQLLIVALIAAVVLPVLHYLFAIATRPRTVQRSRTTVVEASIYLVTVVSVAVLSWTAFYAVLRWGVMDGWLLFVHMVGAGGFTLALPLLAVRWSAANHLTRSIDENGSSERRWLLSAVAYWLLLASGFVALGTMLLSMLPLFGTDEMHVLVAIHRYSGLAVFLSTVFHIYGVLLRMLGWSGD